MFVCKACAFQPPQAAFAALDLDSDGEVTAADFARSDGGPKERLRRGACGRWEKNPRNTHEKPIKNVRKVGFDMF